MVWKQESISFHVRTTKALSCSWVPHSTCTYTCIAQQCTSTCDHALHRTSYASTCACLVHMLSMHTCLSSETDNWRFLVFVPSSWSEHSCATPMEFLPASNHKHSNGNLATAKDAIVAVNVHDPRSFHTFKDRKQRNHRRGSINEGVYSWNQS